MTTPDHNSQPCAALPHVIGTITVVRCGHRESFTGTMWCVLDGGNDGPELLSSESIDFGPFDTQAEIEEWTRRLCAQMVRTVGIVHLD